MNTANRIGRSIISDVAAVEISSLTAEIEGLLAGLGSSFPEPNRQTIVNLLNAARVLGRTADLLPFIAEKLGRRERPIRGWGGVLTAVRNDLGSWKVGVMRGPDDATADKLELAYVKDRLNEDRTRYQPKWPPCDDWTAANVLRAARYKYPDASPSNVVSWVRQYMIELRVESWGGIVTALRKGWAVKRAI